jgi:hypothetical protein
VLLGLAIYGFYISLAGQKIFEAKFLKDVEIGLTQKCKK